MRSSDSIEANATLLNSSDIDRFMRDGLFVHHWRFRDRYVQLLIDQLSTLRRRVDAIALESDGHTPRAVHGGFEENTVFDRLTRLDVLVGPVEQILDDRVYIYQFKVNLKAAFDGDLWPWHQDYSFWAKEDEMPFPHALTAGIFLDDVTEFNGPMYFIPGSHKNGCHDLEEGQLRSSHGNTWLKHVGASLSYQTDRAKLARLAAAHGMVAPKGPRGTVMLFDCNVVHASPANISPTDRRILFITYNSIKNLPKKLTRPPFLVNRNANPVDPFSADEVVEPAHVADTRNSVVRGTV